MMRVSVVPLAIENECIEGNKKNYSTVNGRACKRFVPKFVNTKLNFKSINDKYGRCETRKESQ